MEMPLEIQSSANNCLYDYACLNENGHKICKVKHCVSDELLFVDKTSCTCAYKMNFGNEFVCNCPVRKEIYFRYKV